MYTKAQPFAEFGVFEMTKKAFKSRNVVTLPYSTMRVDTEVEN